MRIDRLTTKSQEALRAAVDLATQRGNPELIPEHLLLAILEQDGGVGAPLVQRAGADPEALVARSEARIESLPQVSGGAEPSFGRRTVPLLQQAEDEAKTLKDDFVSVEHFLLARGQARQGRAGRLRSARALATTSCSSALAEMRGSQRVTDQDPEGKFQALEKYTRDLTDARARAARSIR